MSTYTKDLNNIYFLNDKNIVQELHGTATPDINAIPSLSLLQDSYEELSGYTNALSDSLSNTISVINENLKTADKVILLSVNGISAKVNLICSDISSKINLIELSAAGISAAVEDKFVHKSGDDITYLNVLGQLSAKNNVEIDGNTRIHGSLIQGESVKATQKGGIALGISAEAVHTNSFVWNGNDNIENYQSHGERGTFNINPEQGVNGFFIGDKSLSAIIKDDVKIAYDDLSSQVYNVSSAICANIDARRSQDKAELSNVLSTYTNSKISELCVTVDNRRSQDKAELSNVLSTYANDICIAISSTIDADKYGIASTLSIDYDKNTRNIFVQIKDRFGEIRTSELSFDKVTSSQIVDCVEVLTPPTPGIDVPTIRIWWMPKPAAGETLKSTDIPVADLAQVYKQGDGITITQDLSICVNDTIARVERLNVVSSDVITLSTETIPTININVANIQEYVDALSVDRDTKRGIICQLSDAIKLNANNISSVSSSFEKISVDICDDISSISTDVETIKHFDNMLCVMVDKEGGKAAVGVIPDMRHDIDLLATEIRTATNYGGIITICKYHPDWITSGYGNNLSSIFKWANLAVEDKLKNGNLYQILFTPDKYEYDNTTFAADQSYTTDDGYVLHHKDWLYVATGDSTVYVPLTALTQVNVHHIQAVNFDEYHQLSNVVRANYPWLAGNNTRDAIYEISVETRERVPVIISAEGHSFGSNNDFEGNNRFYGINYFLCSETDFNSISCRGVISAAGTISSATSLRAANNNVVADSAGLSVGNMLSVANKVDLLTSNIVIDNTGISSKYDISVDADVYIGSNLYVAENLKVTRTETEITQPTTIKNTTKIENNFSVDDVLSTAKANKTLTVNNLKVNSNATINALTSETISTGTLNVDWSKVINPSNSYTLLNLSTDLSNSINTLSTNLSNEIGKVRTVFKDLYNKIDTITIDSKISDIISSVVELKKAISQLTVY